MSMAENVNTLEPNREDIMDHLTLKPLTKKLRREICQQIIDRCPIGAEFPVDDLAVFNEMRGTGWLAAKHMRNTERPDPRHVHVLDNGRWRAFSWNKAISPRTDWTELCAVMRKLAEKQTKEYARETSETECAYVHKGGCNGPLQVDHCGMPFDDICKEFVAQHGTPELEDGPPGAGKVFKSMEMEAAFTAFHSSRAVYQMLCRSHNASKGNRKPDEGSEQ